MPGKIKFTMTSSDVQGLLESTERTFRKFKVKDLVKTWVDDGPAFGIITAIRENETGVSYDILAAGKIIHRPANYVVKPDEKCLQY